MSTLPGIVLVRRVAAPVGRRTRFVGFNHRQSPQPTVSPLSILSSRPDALVTFPMRVMLMMSPLSDLPGCVYTIVALGGRIVMMPLHRKMLVILLLHGRLDGSHARIRRKDTRRLTVRGGREGLLTASVIPDWWRFHGRIERVDLLVWSIRVVHPSRTGCGERVVLDVRVF
jgi:hypothetical protein